MKKMIQDVTELLNLDVYRDGGSLSASYKGKENNVQYTILYPIDKSPAFDKNIKECTFKTPVIEIYEIVDNLSPITGLATPQTNKSTEPVSWKETLEIINKIKPHMQLFKSDYLWVFKKMSEVAENNARNTTT